MWDARSLKKPLFTATDLPSLNDETNLVFSPDERYILTGTAGAHAGVMVGTVEEEKAREAVGANGGKVVVLRREGLGLVRSLSECGWALGEALADLRSQISLLTRSSRSFGTRRSTKFVLLRSRHRRTKR